MVKKMVLLIAAGLCLAVSSQAAVPKLLNYQGMLLDASGKAVDGVRSIEFSLFQTESGGEAVWTERYTVQVKDGLFDVILGSITPLSDVRIDSEKVYMEITVESDPPMKPRKQIVSVAFAFQADDADHLQGYGTDAFVRKINDVHPAEGTINLVAGANVTITPNPGAHEISIAASGGASGDNLGNHTATQNIRLNGKWLSNDGGNEGIQIDNSGNVSIPQDVQAHGAITAVGEIQSNADLIAVRNVSANGGYITTGTPATAYDFWDIAASDDIIADDQVRSGGSMVCGRDLSVRHHAGINMEGVSPTYPFYVNGSMKSTEDILTDARLITGGHCGINFGGYSTTYALRVNGNAYCTGTWQSSDLTLKKEIATIDNSLARIRQLQGVSYLWKTEEYQDREFSAGTQFGLIAQEVEQVFPEMVMTDEKGEKALAYYQLIPVLLEALKQQQEQIEALQRQIGQ